MMWGTQNSGGTPGPPTCYLTSPARLVYWLGRQRHGNDKVMGGVRSRTEHKCRAISKMSG